jgi:hypothetical protein
MTSSHGALDPTKMCAVGFNVGSSLSEPYVDAPPDDGEQQRPTDAAACVVPVLVAPDQQRVPARDDPEMLAGDTAERLEHRAGAGTAVRAVTAERVLEGVLHLVLDRAALATAVQERVFCHAESVPARRTRTLARKTTTAWVASGMTDASGRLTDVGEPRPTGVAVANCTPLAGPGTPGSRASRSPARSPISARGDPRMHPRLSPPGSPAPARRSRTTSRRGPTLPPTAQPAHGTDPPCRRS